MDLSSIYDDFDARLWERLQCVGNWVIRQPESNLPAQFVRFPSKNSTSLLFS